MENKYLFSAVCSLCLLGLTGCNDDSGDQKTEPKKEQAAKEKSVAEAQKASFSGTKQGANGESVPTEVATEIQQTTEQSAQGATKENTSGNTDVHEESENRDNDTNTVVADPASEEEHKKISEESRNSDINGETEGSRDEETSEIQDNNSTEEIIGSVENQAREENRKDGESSYSEPAETVDMNDD